MFHLLEEGGITRVACGCQTHFQLMVPPKATQTAMPVEKVKYNQYVPFCWYPYNVDSQFQKGSFYVTCSEVKNEVGGVGKERYLRALKGLSDSWGRTQSTDTKKCAKWDRPLVRTHPYSLLWNWCLGCHIWQTTFKKISWWIIWLFQECISAVHYKGLFSKLTTNKVKSSNHSLTQCCQLFFSQETSKHILNPCLALFMEKLS